MRNAIALLVSCAFTSSACSTTQVRTERHETELALVVPEAVAENEPMSRRVTVLLGSGRHVTFENATLHRDASTLWVDQGPGTPLLGRIRLEDARAVQLESLPAVTRGKSDDEAPSDGVPAGPVLAVLGTLAALTALLVAVND